MSVGDHTENVVSVSLLSNFNIPVVGGAVASFSGAKSSWTGSSASISIMSSTEGDGAPVCGSMVGNGVAMLSAGIMVGLLVVGRLLVVGKFVGDALMVGEAEMLGLWVGKLVVGEALMEGAGLMEGDSVGIGEIEGLAVGALVTGTTVGD